MVLEKDYQLSLTKRLRGLDKKVVVTKNDPNVVQGIPDLSIFYQDKFVFLEVKKDAKAKHQPNQDYYINHFNDYGYSAFIYPENETEIIREVCDYMGLDFSKWK